MVINTIFNFVKNDNIFLDLNKDTLELNCTLDIDGIVFSGDNNDAINDYDVINDYHVINDHIPDDFNYYYTILIQTDKGDKLLIQKVFVELSENRGSGVYSFEIKDFKKNLYDIIQIFTDDVKSQTTLTANEIDAKLLDRFKGLDTINVVLSVVYIDKNLDLPSLEFETDESFSNITDITSIKREKFIIPSMDYKENVFYVSETNNFPYKYEISWDKIKLFKKFLITIYCGDENILTFKTTETKIDFFNFTVDNKSYNLKNLLGYRTDASLLRIEIKMNDSNIYHINDTYTFSYKNIDYVDGSAPTTITQDIDETPILVGITPATPNINAHPSNIFIYYHPIDNSLQNNIYLKYRKFFPNQIYVFKFNIDWSKYTNNRSTHIHNKVERSDSTLVFDITSREYPYKILYFFGNVDIIVTLRDILSFIFTFPWDVVKDIGINIKDVLHCLNIDLNGHIVSAVNKGLEQFQSLSALIDKPNPSSGNDENDEDDSDSGWKDILQDSLKSCKKPSTTSSNAHSSNEHSSNEHSSNNCDDDSNKTNKEKNYTMSNTLRSLHKKIIQFNNLLPRATIGTYIFNNKDDKLGFCNLNNGTPYALLTVGDVLFKSIFGNNSSTININKISKKNMDEKKLILSTKKIQIDSKIKKNKNILHSINKIINNNLNTYESLYSSYITEINNGNDPTSKLNEIEALNEKNILLENEVIKINTIISGLLKDKIDITINDINKNSTIDLEYSFNSLDIVLSVDSPSSNEKSYIINFIDKKNVETTNFYKKWEYEDCKKCEHEDCKNEEHEHCKKEEHEHHCKNEEHENCKKEEHEHCKPHSNNILLNTFVNKF